jgi:hypothetical protein
MSAVQVAGGSETRKQLSIERFRKLRQFSSFNAENRLTKGVARAGQAHAKPFALELLSI